MLRWFLRRQLNAQEKSLGASVDYLRHVLDVSPSAFLRFVSIMPFANSRKTLPKEAWFVAQLTALKLEDCGACVQIGVNLARRAGVDGALIHATLAEDADVLSPEMFDVMRFTQSVVNASYDESNLRETLRSRYGERGLIELAYAIASSRIPPTVKRALGYAVSCGKATVDA